MTSTPIGRQAVVVGAGMAGLPAAGALADYFEHVVVLECDILPSQASHRAGTPQSRHAHALLVGGQHALGDLFTGFEPQLADAGAVPLRVGLDLRIESPGYDPFPARDLGLMAYSMSRPLIEFAVRRRLEQHAGITIRERCRARELVASPDGAAVSAIRFEDAEGRSETLAADLVVEASGRGNLTLQFLEAMGRSLPEETRIAVDIGYATAIFAIPDDMPADWTGVMTFDSPPRGGLGGLLLPLERKRWIVTLAGRHGDKPPGDWDGFLAHARRLRTPTIHAAIERAARLGGVERFGFPASVRRHFDRLKEFPRGLLPLGDAMCRFNPVYGQGMSVAAQEACLLREVLRRRAEEADPLAELAPAFFSESARLIETPWALAAVPDFAVPKTEGPRPEDLEQALEFAEALSRLAAEDAAIHKLLVEVLHLLKPRSVLNDPDIVARVKALSARV
jgi:2-polyprenyl-6-methoxyphenol hydroxylase-like FAD-dependent oxidoreductase